MPTFTVTYTTDTQKDITLSPSVDLQEAGPPPIAITATPISLGDANDNLQGAGPPQVVEFDATGSTDLQGAGPPPVASLGDAGTEQPGNDLKGAGPPPIPGFAPPSTMDVVDADLQAAGPPPVAVLGAAQSIPFTEEDLQSAGPPAILGDTGAEEMEGVEPPPIM